jgi:hypothetical protein
MPVNGAIIQTKTGARDHARGRATGRGWARHGGDTRKIRIVSGWLALRGRRQPLVRKGDYLCELRTRGEPRVDARFLFCAQPSPHPFARRLDSPAPYAAFALAPKGPRRSSTQSGSAVAAELHAAPFGCGQRSLGAMMRARPRQMANSVAPKPRKPLPRLSRTPAHA